MNLTREIQKSIEKIDAEIAESERIGKLYVPLCDHLMPIRRQYNIERRPLKGRFIYLSALVWPKQFEEGIDRCAGFDIRWTGVKNHV